MVAAPHHRATNRIFAMSKVQELNDYLARAGGAIKSVVPSSDTVAAEAMAGAILDSLLAVERGEFEVVAEI